MDVRIVLSLTFVLIAALNVPLILRRVSPNEFYGFRTPRTMASPEVWYPANALAGRALLIAAIVSLALTWLVPVATYTQLWMPLLICIGPLLLAVVACFMYLRGL